MALSNLMTKAIWQEADAVCFDVDSTLIREEGIDGLAEHCGTGAQVSEWTKKAMGGSVTFQEALRTRLEIIHPTFQQLSDFGNSRQPEEIITPGIQELISLLHARGRTVYLVSGGFRRLIEPVAEFLDIPKENIFANRILFNKKGEYNGFDQTELTCRSGGKPKVLKGLKEKHNKIVMIGDGMTDMEASPPADAFIGFGGNVVREKVKANASWFVYSVQELIDELQKGKNSAEPRKTLRVAADGSGESFNGVHLGYKAAEGVEVPLSPTTLAAAN